MANSFEKSHTDTDQSTCTIYVFCVIKAIVGFEDQTKPICQKKKIATPKEQR